MAKNDNSRKDVPNQQQAAGVTPPPELSADALKQSLGTVDAYMGSAGAEVDRLAAQAVANIARYGSQSQAAAEQAAARQRQLAAENLAAYDRLGSSMGWSAQAKSPGRQSVARAGQRGAEDIALLGDVNRWLSGQVEAANRTYFDQARAGVTAASQDAKRRISGAFASAYDNYVRRAEEERQRRLSDPSFMKAEASAAAGQVRAQMLGALDERIKNAKSIEEAAQLLAEKNRLLDAPPSVWEYHAANQVFGAGAGDRLYGFGADEFKLSPEGLARQQLLAAEIEANRRNMAEHARLYERNRPAPGSLADQYGSGTPAVNEAAYAQRLATQAARMFEGSYGLNPGDQGNVTATMQAMGMSPAAMIEAGYPAYGEPDTPQIPIARELRAAPEYREALQDLTMGALLSDGEEDEYSIPNWIKRTRTDEENQDISGIEEWLPSWRDLRRYFVEEFDMDEFTADRFVRDYGADIEVALRQLGFGVYDEEL